MKTSLYLPFTDFKINGLEGEKILYENLVQSGPAYKLIVHESTSWEEIKDKMPRAEMIEILPNKRAQEYKEVVNKFFSPITEAARYYVIEDKKYPMENLTLDLRRALSYILIAHDFKARIYEDDILKPIELSEILKRQNVFSEEAIQRVEFVENLIRAYQKDSVSALSVNRDARIFKDLMDLLDKEEIQILSEKDQLFGVIKVQKDMLKREIKERITQVIRNEWFPYLTETAAMALSYVFNIGAMEKALRLLTRVGAKVLSRYDFREYAPPIQSPDLFELVKDSEFTFSYTPFNYEVKIFIEYS